MKIAVRLFLCLLLIVAAGFYYLVGWITGELRPRYLESVEESLVDTSHMLAGFLSAESTGGALNLDRFRNVFQDVQKTQLDIRIYDQLKTCVDVRVYVTDTKGIVLFDSDHGADEGKDYSNWNDVHRTLQGEYGARSTRVNPKDPATSILYVSAPVLLNGKLAGVLTVCKPTTSSNLFIQGAKRKIMTAGILAGCVVVLLSVATVFWVTLPIRRLTAYAEAIRDGRRAALPRLGHSEITVMGRALEEMRTALEGKEYIEQYVQTLTHELKGPLSAIHGAAELMSEPDIPSAQRTRFLGNIKRETERIRDLVDRLLLLSSLESRDSLQDVEKVDLKVLLRDTEESFRSVAEGKGITMALAATNPVFVHGDPFLIRQALANLLQNALDFTPAGGSVSLSVQVSQGRAQVMVEDTGSGIPDYALDKIFDRFYSLQRPGDGRKSSGLGLALVKQVAALHGGSIRISNRPEGGARAVLDLPLIS
ncbi:MAG: two-component system sensor histidine kinase CreC [Lentisphaerota bacterium]